MDESRLRTIAKIQAFLEGSDEIGFSPHAGDEERYAHISRVLKRFDYPRPQASRARRIARLSASHQWLLPRATHAPDCALDE